MNTYEAYTIPEFCQAHRISRGTFYNLRKAGRAPRTMDVNARVLITREAAAEWRREMEGATSADAAVEEVA